MIKLIYYLIICSTLLFHGCGERNTMPKGPEENNSNNKKEDTDIKTALTADEEQKFNVLKAGLDTILENRRHTLKEHKENIKIINENYLKEIENILSKYTVFMEWLENNPQKKKQLANAFTTFYDFLNDQRIKQSSTLTNEQLIVNTINCQLRNQNKSNASCNDNNYAYNTLDKNFRFDMYIVFHLLLTEIKNQNTNYEIFEAMLQDRLLQPDPSIAKLIGTDRLEAMIRREKLNDSQRQGLNFLKEAFTNLIKADEKLHIFLISDLNKIKMVFDHINSELLKCNEDATKKDTFKDAIKNYFNVISTQKLNEFKDQVKSGC